MPWLPANPRTEKEMAIHINEMTLTHLAQIFNEAGFNSRIWLKELLVEQARWHKQEEREDFLGRAYTLFANPTIGTVYKILAKTPLRLLIVNEMFALAWKEKQHPTINVPSDFTERFIIKLKN
jgi:hypothetical protein